jgi:ribose transport system substrate-binding protein
MRVFGSGTWVGVALAAALAVAACGGSGGTGASAGGVKAASTGPLPANGCGSLPQPKTLDPDGIVATLPAQYRAAYAGYEPKTQKSAWATWKPKHAPPYTIGVQWNAVTTPFQADMIKRLKAGLEKLPGVGTVILQTTGNNIDVGQGLQIFASMLNRGVDLIITEPLQGDAYLPSVRRAQAKGVPVLTALGAVDDPAAVNIDYNAYLASAETTARAAQMIGAKGNVLYGAGIAGTGPDIYGKEGFDAALKNCPGLKDIGSIFTGFVPALAKGEALKFLATHPQKIDLVFTSGPFVPGIMQAFKQTGRPIPPVIDNGGTRGMLGYWRQNQGKYHAIGAGVTSPGYSQAIVGIAGRMLAGRGPKVNNFVTVAPILNDKNLDTWSQPGWTLATPGQPDGPANSFMTPAYIDGLFGQAGS